MNRLTATLALATAAAAGGLVSSTPLGHAAARLVLPAGSIGTAQMKANAITSAKVKDGTLLAKDFKSGQLPAGTPGPAGPKGDPGPAGSIASAPAGGALTGTYPSPQLAANAVTGAKVADRSLEIVDIAAASGQVSVNLPAIGAHSCASHDVGISRTGRDRLLLQPTGNLPPGIVVMTLFNVDDGASFTVRACNVTGGALDAPTGNWGYAVLR